MSLFDPPYKAEAGAYSLPFEEEEFLKYQPVESLLRKTPLNIPQVSELNLTRHFIALSRKNVGIDNIFYPLGSCTMKFNPRVNEQAVNHPCWLALHPLAPDETVQGALEVIYHLLKRLCSLSGMRYGSLNPSAGAQGEFVGIKMIQRYHQERGDRERTEILVPDSAHGTNPATAKMAGYTTLSIDSAPNGDLSIEDLRRKLSSKTAALMLTNPNTLGLFSERILEISSEVHEAGGLLYYDGANLNAIMNRAKPGEMGFDVMHINLHKTFSTPHGGGGPGSGPVLCGELLAPFLPLPEIILRGETYHVDWKNGRSIGSISTFFGNFLIYLRAYLYILLHGDFGLRKVSDIAVLNANYLKAQLTPLLTVPYPQYCMHEFVVQADRFLEKGVRALDFAKRLLDYGIHSPTVYFPLIVKEALLIEPTECESKETLDRFVKVMETIISEIEKEPKLVTSAPETLSVSRLDEVKAAKTPVLRGGK